MQVDNAFVVITVTILPSYASPIVVLFAPSPPHCLLIKFVPSCPLYTSVPAGVFSVPLPPRIFAISGLPMETIIEACYQLADDCRANGTRFRLGPVLKKVKGRLDLELT